MDWKIVLALYRLKLRKTLANLSFGKDCKQCQANKGLIEQYKVNHL